MTIVPRTGPLSASSALFTTSWYQRGKSSLCGVSTGGLAMAGHATGAPNGGRRVSSEPGHPGAMLRMPGYRRGHMARITMPQLGETVTEGTVTRWLKSVGDEVGVDEPLLEVS